MLEKIENKTAPILKKIKEENYTPPESGDDYKMILLFITFLSLRTKYQKEEIQEIVDKTIKTALKSESNKNGYSDLSSFNFTISNPIKLRLQSAKEMFVTLSDLKYKILKNKTKKNFITSDNPVIKYNQFLNSKDLPFSTTGFALKGF